MWLPLLVLLGLLFLYRRYRHGLILENLTDKYVFITGCDTGFGNLLAKQLDKRGMRVLAACLTDHGAEELKKETSTRLQTILLDVTNSQSVSAAAEWVNSIVLDTGLWGLVNNAGISIPTALNELLTKDDFARIFNVNLLGLIDVTLKMLPIIRKAQGRVVNVASIAGRIAVCGGGYCISKYGVEAFSDSLRREISRFGVKVSIIEPGCFKTFISSPERIIEKLHELWEMASEEIRCAYGQKHFDKYCKQFEAFSNLNPKLHQVTDCMEHALTAVYPQTRYSAGLDAKLYFIPLSYCPTVIADFFFPQGPESCGF
ncbi:retinol dehydrogenase 7-like isoform X2 [Hyla sarda]|nr:retinol dehydrogenase 7-like isoform X2 [Hyla sarda]XP_056418452.1 retinol dehydrogenase 7-like isoform X2 [Hyla sarda]XP_056418453.1 retinol dehydrogenase 7-like isoform X2 [Hyla sarda]XP_056418454.1 retinol dehydrogenase 7-like isoform X2 [Hyla sarda]XP_056418455.1 retinol dehydrogenase 7-like isoform X2 [Hyla sarda]XP_056418456.1 retinol dehydrogenase 7-like isoform X2 [Hyla sarda]